MNDPWALFNAGRWLVFLTWAIALHLCGDQREIPEIPVELAVGEHGRPGRDDHAVCFSTTELSATINKRHGSGPTDPA